MWTKFLKDRRAAVLPIFAIALIPMIVATGAVIDYARAFAQRAVIQDAMDAAALASGKKIGKVSDTLVKAEADNFYNSNIATNKVDTIPPLTKSITSATITLTTTLTVKTYFLGLIGLNQFVFSLKSQTTQAAGTLEVAMVLDNSTSMCLGCSAADQDSDDTKIGTLKTAAKELATTLWALGATSTKVDPVKIAVVPFGASVNIGSANTAWIDTTGAGTYAADSMKDSTLLGTGNYAAASFNPYSVFSTLKDSSGNAVGWGGCVEERPDPYDISDDAPSTAGSPTTEQKKTLFEPLVAPDEPDNWTCSTTSCNYFGTTTSTRRYNGAPTSDTPDFNNYLPDAGDGPTCGTFSNTVTITAGTPAVFNKTSHGIPAATPLVFSTTGVLPTGVTAGTTYYVSPAGLTSSAFRVATTTTGTNFTIGAAYTTVTISNAAAAVFTANGHGLVIGDDLVLSTTGTLPTGLTNGSTYYVASTTTNSFTVTAASAATAVTITKASPGVLTTTANHGLAVGNTVVLKTAGTLPAPLAVNTVYYVKTVPSAKTFTLATTSGGTVINTTSNGSSTHSYVRVVGTSSAGSGTHSYTIPGTPSVFTATSHGLAANDAVTISSTGTYPTGLAATTVYYVKTVPTTSTFTLSATSGGTAITTSGSFTGTLSFIKLLATTSSTQSGTHTYNSNVVAYTCQSGSAACGGAGIGVSEKAAFGGQSVSGSPLCKYGTTTNKGTVANFTISGITAGPNFMCSTTAITPLTTTQATITSAITAMKANGYTNITSGLMWGWRALSSGLPFSEGRSEDTTDNKKVIVLMTDGENTYLPYLQADTNPGSSTSAGKFLKSAYGAWGYIAENHLGTTSTTSQTIFDKLNARTAAACVAAKAAGITIYTVGFEINDATSSDPVTALALLKGCATDTAKYYDAQDETALLAAFTAIGTDISQLRLSE